MPTPIEAARRRPPGGSPSAATATPARVAPHNLQAEESLLGAMLLSRDAIATAVEICSAEDFYRPNHGHVFEAICSLYSKGEGIDAVTVGDELSRAGVLDAVGGLPALLSLQVNTPATSNAGRYAKIVEEHALLRRLIGVAGEIAELGYSVPEDVVAAVDKAESMVFEVAQRRVTDTLAPLHDLLSAALDRLGELYERNEAITGVPTGYHDLDEQLAGLQKSALLIVGARPAMGKTAFALGMAAHAAMEAREPVLFFSLEMSHAEITSRLLCAEARVDATRMRNGKLQESDWGKISHAIGRLGEAPLYIDDNPNLTIMDIRAKARRLKSKLEGKLGLIVIDYLQLMTGRQSAENRQVEVSEISRGLKILARELEVPVVALSQLSRNLEMRADKRPILADLRESGCMPASTRLQRADTGEEVTLGELVLTQEQPLVWTLDDHWRLVPRRLVKAFPSGVKPTYRLRLASGYEVEATANHPFRTIDGWVALEDLRAGDSIAVPRRMPAPVGQPEDWDEDELVLLAHLLGDGTMGSSSVKYRTADDANKQVVESAAKRRFGIDVTGKKLGKTWQLWFPSPYPLTHNRHHPVRNWLEPLGLWGSRSQDKFIPESLFRISDEQVALFLHHLWATDGSVTISCNGGGPFVNASYATTSRLLADGVRRLLLRLDIRARIEWVRKGRTFEFWRVVVDEADQVREFLGSVGRHRDQRGRISEALEIVERTTRGQNRLAQPATSDVFWDEIVEITPVGLMPTFDATVEDTHNFIANGIIAHNSLEQDADVVMFLYRDEIYNAETSDKGVAEVIVSKHRNGPTGFVRLAFLDHYTRFANMARGV
jgi:replicative DNA helicase